MALVTGSPSRFLLIGGAGFVGYHLAQRLVPHGEVVVLDAYRCWTSDVEFWTQQLTQRRKRLRLHGVRFARPADAADEAWLRAQFREHVTPETCVVHLAALPIVNVAERAPGDAERCIDDTLETALWCANDYPPDRLVYVSSSMVYGDWPSPDFAMPEEHEPDPQNRYGELKLDGEIAVRSSNTPHVIVRPSAAYGPLDSNGRVVEKFLRQAKEGEPLTPNSLAGPSDFTHVYDLADGLRLACTKPGAIGETFNLTRGESRTLGELCDAVKNVFPSAEVEWSEQQCAHPQRGALSIAKARRLLGYEPRWSLRAGVAQYAEIEGWAWA